MEAIQHASGDPRRLERPSMHRAAALVRRLIKLQSHSMEHEAVIDVLKDVIGGLFRVRIRESGEHSVNLLMGWSDNGAANL